MRSNTILKRAAILALTPLRRLSDWMGEIGAFLMMAAPMFTAMTLLDLGHPRRNIPCLITMAVVALAIFARSQDGEGRRALRRLNKQHAKTGTGDATLARGLDWLNLPSTASVDDVKAAVRVLIKRHHTDKGRGRMDMLKLVTFRDDVIARLQSGAPAQRPLSRVTQILAYEKAAGRLGRTWGHMFPTKRLRDLGYE